MLAKSTEGDWDREGVERSEEWFKVGGLMANLEKGATSSGA